MRITLLVALLCTAGCSSKPDANPSSQPISGQCDSRESNGIINGRTVDKESRLAKGLVAIKTDFGAEKPDLCTGALIAPNVILTAAHCVSGDASKTQIYFSTRPDCSDSAGSSSQVRSVKRIVRHHGYDESTHLADLALVFLSEKAPEGSEPFSMSFDSTAVDNETPVHVAGYGLQKDLDQPQVPDSKLKMTSLFPAKEESDASFLILNASEGAGPCQGDSGGPAFLYRGRKIELVGIASFVFDQNKQKRTCLSRAAYTRVSHYQMWLSEASQDLITVEE